MESDEDWQRTSGGFARNALSSVDSFLKRDRINPSILVHEMDRALHWAVESWLRGRNEPAFGNRADQEARFLSLASPELQDSYLSAASHRSLLVNDLFDQLGSASIQDIAIDAPSLGPWRERARAWVEEVAGLHQVLLAPHPLRRAPAIERGQLRGRLHGLLPCLLLARGGAPHGRWRRAPNRRGLFALGEADSDRRGYLAYEALILPLSLCREEGLRRKLFAFASLLTVPGSHAAPLWNADRKSELQSWLDSEGLAPLRLVDRGEVGRWPRLALDATVFKEILAHFDYVVTLADRDGQATQVLDHAPFAWASQSALLDWELEGQHDLDRPILPFGLYLATEAQGLSTFAGSRSAKESLFRPLSYWGGFTQPASGATACALSVGLLLDEDSYGWIDLHMTLGEQTAVITLSDAFDPFPALLNWLQALSEGDLPLGLEIDEESERACLAAHPFGEGQLLLCVYERWSNEVRAAGVVEQGALLRAFRQEIVRFFHADWPRELWAAGREDPSYYATRLLLHPFLK